MAFPDDYKRVQMAGGVQTDIASHLGLPRQLLVDTTNLNVRLMDGVTAGGHTIQMVKNLDGNIQGLNNMEGEVEYVETGTDTPGEADQKRRLWKASKLRLLFLKIADITLVESTYIWSIKNSVLPIRLRTNASLVTDPNLSTMTGWSRVLPGSVNLPGDAPSAGSVNLMLEVISQGESDLIQILYARDGTGKIWTRSRSEGDWASWILATGLTSVDLNTRLAKAGDSMIGKLTLAASSNVRAALNLLAGDDVTTPEDGDIWRNSSTGLRFRKGGTTRTILDSDNGVAFVSNNAKAVAVNQTLAIVGRAFTTVYQNTTDKPIIVYVQGTADLSGLTADFAIRMATDPGIGHVAAYAFVKDGQAVALSAIIPPGFYYLYHRGGNFTPSQTISELK